MKLNKEAAELNEKIESNSKSVIELLSKRGREIFFPKKGILSQTAQAKGKSINATIGIALEDDGSPVRLGVIEKRLNIKPQNAFPYAPSFGRPDLRAKWKEMMIAKNPELAGKEISLPVVTNALTHGLYTAAYMFADEADEIILSNLYWENYELIFENSFLAKLVTFNLFKEGGFDTIALKEKLSSDGDKKILLLNFPNNPSGYTPTEEEYSEIIDIIKNCAQTGKKIVVIIDDAYFGLVYEEGVAKESIFSKLCNLDENVLAVKLDGSTKEDYVWGFRVGFITYGIKNGTKDLYSALEAKTAGAIRGCISNASNLSQSIMLEAYSESNYIEEKKEKFELLKARFEKAKEVSSQERYKEYFEVLPFNSGYFMCIKLKEGINSEELRNILLEKYDSGIIVFKNIVRIAFSAVNKEKIKTLFENIYNACNEVYK